MQEAESVTRPLIGRTHATRMPPSLAPLSAAEACPPTSSLPPPFCALDAPAPCNRTTASGPLSGAIHSPADLQKGGPGSPGRQNYCFEMLKQSSPTFLSSRCSLNSTTVTGRSSCWR